MEDINEQLAALNEKFDRLIVVVEKLVELKTTQTNLKRGPAKIQENTATISLHGKGTKIQCPPQVEIKSIIKSNGGSWNPSLRAWVLGNANGDNAWTDIQKALKDWTLNDNRVTTDENSVTDE